MPADHEQQMRRALDLARNNSRFPFGAVLVEMATGNVVAEGYNRSDDNPCWHGEIDVINRCAARHPGIDWSGLRLYTTAEPCCMCQGAILWAGIAEVVFGTSIRTLQQMGWNQIDILSEEVVQRAPFGRCAIVGGVLESECDALFLSARMLQRAGQVV
jgi:tRNA(Arg) A34 adenosine deaminase TadA